MTLGFAVGLSGLAFGAAAIGAGLTVWQACALSLLAYTGASQFALAGVIGAAGNLLAGAAGAIVLGSRNALYGLQLAGLLGAGGLRRLAVAHGVTDESAAIAIARQDQRDARAAFGATFAVLYLTWNLATLAGAIRAGAIRSPQRFGLDVIGPAAFAALLWPRLRSGRSERRVALAGAVVAIGLTPVLPPGVPVILAAAAALVAALAPAPDLPSPPAAGRDGGPA
jgi:predicted branched-subunit amino acid permease